MSSDGEAQWWVYLLACRDGSLYAGATPTPGQRFWKHANGRGAKYTRSRGVDAIAFAALVGTKGEALSAEAKIKRWTAAQKRALVAEFGTQSLTFLPASSETGVDSD